MATAVVEPEVVGGPTSAIPATLIPPTSYWYSHSAEAITMRNAIKSQDADPAQRLLKFDTLFDSLTNPTGDNILFSCKSPGPEKQWCIEQFMAIFSWTPDTDVTLQLTDATVKWNYHHFGLDLSDMRRYINKTSGPLPSQDTGTGSEVASSLLAESAPSTGGADQASVRRFPAEIAPYVSPSPPVEPGQLQYPQDGTSKVLVLRPRRAVCDTTYGGATQSQTVHPKESVHTCEPQTNMPTPRARQLRPRAKRRSEEPSLPPRIEHVKSLSDHIVPYTPNRMVDQPMSFDAVSCQQNPGQLGARRQSAPAEYAGPANQHERQGSSMMPPPAGRGYPMAR